MNQLNPAAAPHAVKMSSTCHVALPCLVARKEVATLLKQTGKGKVVDLTVL